ncbi:MULTISPECIES: hypothetical protein [unclassified Bacillus (in: firmicutes)]|uniref:hypothetical protein n=1 Tax=unclassified Bacillus (in: firmicutes) TaxID=185979 RepID=UPI0008E4E229|nr:MULTISPECIES: hypothetical protein [unclassified Bacillus (in: firmicutes)]SFA70000.1 hypothetical protein SAMN02799634_10174 [Bacillus sp. UNCCL13]SFQ59451.1 hypothetical protein SAMN04488577_0358 [Bacillus sp. cl95]
MRFLLELIRIIVIFVIFGGLFGSLLENVYLVVGTDTNNYGWIGSIAILILFFVVYRNKLQFSGWYKGKGRERLPIKVSKTLILSAITLLLIPPFFSLLMN